MASSLRGELALRNRPAAPCKSGLFVVVTGRHALVSEALTKLVAARLWVGMNRPMACDVEYGTDGVETLLIEPAFSASAPHRVAIGRGLARAQEDMAALVIVDEPLYLLRQVLQRLHIQHDHGGRDGEPFEVAQQGLGIAAGEAASSNDESAGGNEPVLLDSDR